jgi:hypothetical protein
VSWMSSHSASGKALAVYPRIPVSSAGCSKPTRMEEVPTLAVTPVGVPSGRTTRAVNTVLAALGPMLLVARTATGYVPWSSPVTTAVSAGVSSVRVGLIGRHVVPPSRVSS